VTVRVDDDKAQCPHAKAKTIGRALTLAPPGATILVCPGAYSGPLRMTKPGVRVVGLTGRRLDVTVTAARGDRVTPIVEMSAPGTSLANVTVREFNCARTGVLVDNGPGSFTEASVIENVTVRQGIADNLDDCAFFDFGFGIAIGGVDADVAPGRALVRHSTIVARTDGVAVSAGSTAGIRHNVIERVVSFTDQSDGAIAIFGGTARILRNNLSGFNAGVWVLDGQAVIGGGPRNGNDIHGALEGVALGVDAGQNVAARFGFQAMSAGVRATVADNDIHHNQEQGLEVRTADSIVARNRIHDNGSNGILVEIPAEGNPPAAGNRFLHNIATNNGVSEPGTLDCNDFTTGTGTAGTANTWIDNIGESSFPPGICRPPGP